MKLKLIFSILFLTLAQTQAASRFDLSGEKALKMFDKLEKVNILSYDGYAMGKAYYKVNDSLCLFESEKTELECNDTKMSDKEEAELELETMVQLSLITYDGAAMGGKAYFKTKAEYCYLTTKAAENNKEVSSLHCY